MLVDADGRFLLADFDVSKDTITVGGPEGLVRDGAVEIERTMSDMETTRTSMVGTRGFMAPEVGGIVSLSFVGMKWDDLE